VTKLEISKLFSGLNREELNAVRWITKVRKYPAGQVIFTEGDNGDGVFVVEEGLVEISAVVSGGTRKVLSQIGPGDFFGEMAVLDYKPRSACATAVTDTTAVFVPRTELLALIERLPALAFTILRETSNRLRDFNRHYVDEMVQAERLAVVGKFARAIVHDLKNPLSIIGLSAEMAASPKAAPEDRARATGIIRGQVESITDLIGEILEFTAPEKGEFPTQVIEYGAYVQKLLEEIRPELALKGVTVGVTGVVGNIPVRVNPKRLARVFRNLLANAGDAMPTGGSVEVRLQVRDGRVFTEVQDSGPGIAPEIADHLFEPFATFGKPHGTGLGLSICKRIVEDHKGMISARSEPGQGAVIIFSLPFLRA
jgi:signal transduction histidine kinase